MVLASPLVCEKVWLDKAKYDAAERRYYESSAQSLVSAKGDVSLNNLSSDVPLEPGTANEDGSEIPQMQHQPIESISLSKPTSAKSKSSGKEAPYKMSNEPSANKKSNKNVSGKSEKKQTKDNNLMNNYSAKCSLPMKPESSNGIIENESVCEKIKGGCKTLMKSIPERCGQPWIEPLSSGKISDDKSDLSKLYGYFQGVSSSLQNDCFIPLPGCSDLPLSKGTNVNTIPEISNLHPCPEKSKNNINLRKSNRVHTLNKQESTDLIIPNSGTNIQPAPNVPVDEQVKKETKKKKKNKKLQYAKEKKGVTQINSWNSLAGEVAKARQHIKNSLQCIDDIAVVSNNVTVEVANRVVSLEKENQALTSRMEKMEQRIALLEKQLQLATAAAAANTAGPAPKKGPAPQPPVKQSNDDDDDGVDLFGSDSEEEDAEAIKIKEQRLAEYAAKKSKKPALIAKSSIVLDVKPWDDETDMKLLEQEVRKIGTEGLLWGASKLVPLAFGIHKLQISCVVEDEKVSVDWLQETIQEIEDYVQSVDIAAFNKI